MQEKAGGHGATVQAGYGILSALITAFGITIPAMLILAAILTFTDYPEKYTTIAVLLATLAGLFIAGFKAGMHNEKNGLVKGALAGLVYMVILYVISSILFKDFMLNQRSVMMILAGILAGAIGGLMGTNRKFRPSRIGNTSRFGSSDKRDSLRKYRGL